ncbi:MAG: DUF2304 domain-containing protein [Acidobacteria bacterium]|nr:DUF2304 domain-containing protein [Acidobacteriota bacterium]
MDRLLNLMTAFSILLIATVLASLRRAHIRVEYSVSWLGAGVLLLVLSQSHALLDRIAAFLGVSYPPAALLFIILGVFFLVFYRFSMIISGLKDSNIALAQRVAILEFELRSPDHPSNE